MRWMSFLDRTVSGIMLRDWPTIVHVRVTVCRRDGHHFGFEQDYCENCGFPWIEIRL